MKVWINVSNYAIGGFCIIFFGYMAQTMFLQYWFYYRRGGQAHTWKIQTPMPTGQSGQPLGGVLGSFYGFPLFSSKPNRAPYHRLLTTINLIVASCACAFTVENSVTEKNKMLFHSIASQTQLLEITLQFIVIVMYESVVEYYWHRLMHWKYFYKYMHKFHHAYKAPEPWDDMYIHPLEAFGYYCILYSPPFLFSIHSYAFIAYMIVMGLCGVLDHSGIKFEVRGLYNTVDHDNHHAKFEVNYSFPFPFMDILHDTYDGEFWGKSFTVRNRHSMAERNDIVKVD
jgi:sterol desaturase/sphingolipid hydroxylase (fatty acid hydroxylase superfamily)